MGAPYFFEVIGMLVIFLFNLPKYIGGIIDAIVHKKQVPDYKSIFYIPKTMDVPIRIRLIGFGAIVLIITATVVAGFIN